MATSSLTHTTCLTALFLCGIAHSAAANPSGGSVAAGSASMQTAGNTLNITQHTDKAVINWNSFDITSSETTNFIQPGAGSIALNRVHSNTASQIDGNLTANGNLLIINQNGVMFGAGAQVDVNGLIVSTADTDNARFMQDSVMTLDQAGNSDAKISNAGSITAREAGLVGFVAPNVENSGIITARLGRVHLATGSTATVDLYGDGLMQVAVSDDIGQQLINSGQITADGGTIALTASAGASLVNNLIHNSGTLQAQQVEQKDGQIIISAAGKERDISEVSRNQVSHTGSMQASNITIEGGSVDNSGTISAENTISVTARTIAQQGQIHSSGGEVRLTASTAYIDSEASRTTSNADDQGGEVHVDGGKRLFASGTYEAKGAQGGEITMQADDSIKLYAAHLDASGSYQGGSIKIGGGFRGEDASMRHAQETVINASTILNASATLLGNAGSVIVWSDVLTTFLGTALATGGTNGGDGGLIELSSADTLNIGTYSVTNASSPMGAAGQLLLDPHNIIISNAGATSPLSFFELVDPNADTGSFGGNVVTLSSGNVVVTDISDDFAATDAGAVYLFNGTTGGLISTLRGSTASDTVGGNGITELTNGNYVVSSISWDNGAAFNAGAVTWGSGTTGISGVVSASNSLIGSASGDQVGSGGITALNNGNYVARSGTWDRDGIANAGAVTWGNGTTGISGLVSVSNSLVGTKLNDQVGSASVTALTNGNYVVRSQNWDNDTVTNAGAVTWGNGATGTSGAVSASNSLVGSTASDNVGGGTLVALSNGNYVFVSTNWDNGGATNAGAVTWGNGSTGISGAVSSSNSLVGSTAGDEVGGSGITALSNGNYVVLSAKWHNGAVINAGAATWGDGTTGINGTVSASNSLVGSTAGNQVGFGGAVALSNGNYVVRSQYWDNGGATNAGAVTWGNGTTGISGVISASNSLVGSTASDQVGNNGITALSNGHYVVSSMFWDNGGVIDAGAVTWGSGATGISGTISASNSLVGSAASDYVSASGITALSNGHYVVGSYFWDNGAVTDVGAATWGNGTTGISGVISASNSLIGSTASDNVSASGITALSNGHYVVASPYWDNGAVTDVGAATWGDGTTGISGAVSSSNSLVGSTANDQVGYGVTALNNGHYVVRSDFWNNGAITNAGAVTWGNGTTGTNGVVSASNSLVGSTAFEFLGSGSITALSNGNYVVQSQGWDNGALADAGAATLGNGLGGTVGQISSENSIIGSSAYGNLQTIILDSVNDRWLASFISAQKLYSAAMDYISIPTSFATQPGTDTTIHPDFITNTLNAGTAVTLQANNDITVDDDIIANNPSGNGGILSLLAGRSILLNADIFTDNGNLNLTANATAADGVIDAQRDAGSAVITMASGASINAGSGDVSILLKDGAGNTNTAAGDLTLRDITAGSIFARNMNSSGDIQLASGTLTASDTGTPITLVSSRNFINSAGSSALSLTGGSSPRWLIYSANPANDTTDSLTADFRRFSCSYGGTCPTLGSGDGFLYSYTPTLTATPGALGLTYGNAASLSGYGYTLSGYLGSDAGSDSLTGSLTGTTTYSQGDNIGSYNINHDSGSLTSAMGYGFNYADNASAITVSPRSITGSVTAGQSKTYGAIDPATYAYTITSGSLYSTDSLGTLTSRTAGENAGNYAISNTLANSNYTISFIGGEFTIASAAQNNVRTLPNSVVYAVQVPNVPIFSTLTDTLFVEQDVKAERAAKLQVKYEPNLLTSPSDLFIIQN